MLELKINRSIFSEFANAGIIRFRDIFDPKTKDGFISFDQIQTTGGDRLSWLRYLTLKRAIPFSLSNLLQTGTCHEEENLVSKTTTKWFNMPKLSGAIYKKLIDYDTHILKYIVRWNDVYNIDFEFDEFMTCFKELYVISGSTKLRDFQYRMLLGKIVTNIHLKEWKLSDSDLCNFCGKHSESLCHLFLDCKYSKRLWQFVNRILNFGPTEVTLKMLISNHISKPTTHIGNTIYLLTKQYIYRNRCLRTKPNIRGLQREICYLNETESYIGKMNNKLLKTQHRWSPVNTELLHNTI